MSHILIVGARGVGKSTLIRRVLDALDRPVFGFETKKEDTLADNSGCPIYIYKAGAPHEQSEENLVGYCKNQRPTTYRDAFDRFAPHLRQALPQNGVILLDELGFMEAASKAFCQAVFALLDGNVPVIAAVKDKDVPFLNEIRSHPNAKCFDITQENRDALFDGVLAFVREDKTWQER